MRLTPESEGNKTALAYDMWDRLWDLHRRDDKEIVSFNTLRFVSPPIQEEEALPVPNEVDPKPVADTPAQPDEELFDEDIPSEEVEYDSSGIQLMEVEWT